MYSFRKSKKGFTLIELMVVVVIIGVLALLGLRLYLTQIAKSNNALIKANAGTVQTTIQAALADEDPGTLAGRWATGDGNLIEDSGIHNPLTKKLQVAAPVRGTAAPGQVWVEWVSADSLFYINGCNAEDTGNVYDPEDLVAKY